MLNFKSLTYNYYYYLFFNYFIFQLHFIFQLLFIFFYVSISLLILLKALEAFLLFLLNDYISFKNVKFQGLGILLVKWGNFSFREHTQNLSQLENYIWYPYICLMLNCFGHMSIPWCENPLLQRNVKA